MNPSKIKIAVFGDSITWGYNPQNGLRYPNRAIGLLARHHPDWIFEEDELCGRLAYASDPCFEDLNGYHQIDRFLEQAAPYLILILQLGSNDARRMFHSSITAWLADLELFIKKAVSRSKSHCPDAEILLVSAPLPYPDLNRIASRMEYSCQFGSSGTEILKQASALEEKLAIRYGLAFLDCSKEGITGGDFDGIHPDEKMQERFAAVLNQKLESLIRKEEEIGKKEDNER